MYIYYFIKYNEDTNYEHIQKYSNTGAILCFDFEDSIYNWIKPEKNSDLKQQFRNYFKVIVNKLVPQIEPLKIGLRINSSLEELEKDIETISTLRINSILIPKVETANQIEIIEKLLDNYRVSYDELIPVIESPKGFFNLFEIIESSPGKINKIGFGHCDHNLNCNIFPFFHQNTSEYWKWITRLSAITVPKNITLINSPCLELENYSLFQSMLCHLHDLFGDNFGQFTLTTKQSILCNTFNRQKNQISFNKFLDTRLDLRVPGQYAIKLIDKFETGNDKKGFTISTLNRTLISPQEYVAAKSHNGDKNSIKVNFTFVGGCFPVQYNILFEDLFHQKLKRKIENNFDVTFGMNIIRYERFNTCLNKIIAYNKSNPVDFLVFHIRPEPFLRLVKFYYKYLNYNGKRKYSLNIPQLKLLAPEKYDILILGRQFYSAPKLNNSKFHKFLVDLNYKAGNFLGNTKFALEKYFELVADVANYCQNSNIKLLLLGPALRTNTSYEPILCKRLNDFIIEKSNNNNIEFIDGLGNNTENFDTFLDSTGIHVTEQYHEMIAERLDNSLRKEIERLVANKIEYIQ